MRKDIPRPRMYLPEWLYRSLPLIYVICGGLMFHLSGDESVGRLGGLFLFAAAILIWGLRLHARRNASRRQP